MVSIVCLQGLKLASHFRTEESCLGRQLAHIIAVHLSSNVCLSTIRAEEEGRRSKEVRGPSQIRPSCQLSSVMSKESGIHLYESCCSSAAAQFAATLQQRPQILRDQNILKVRAAVARAPLTWLTCRTVLLTIRSCRLPRRSCVSKVPLGDSLWAVKQFRSCAVV